MTLLSPTDIIFGSWLVTMTQWARDFGAAQTQVTLGQLRASPPTPTCSPPAMHVSASCSGG